MTKNSGPMQRFVAGLGVGAISVNGLTILQSLEGFLCGAFLLRPDLVPIVGGNVEDEVGTIPLKVEFC